jgi:RNA polymerase sigma-70 factor (ECF subfamily)
MGGVTSQVVESSTPAATRSFDELERHRRELTAYCYRMLGSPFEAEDAVQETLLRAWRALERFEGRSSLRSWLYRIATNVCMDMLGARERRARPMDMGPARPPDGPVGEILPEVTWIEPVPDGLVLPEGGDPAAVAQSRETIRLAFVAALQRLPPRQRAALILCEVLHWRASEVAELLNTSVAAVNSALQRARAALDSEEVHDAANGALSEHDRELLARYVDAFQRYDMEALTALIHEDATQSMPPYELWLSGRSNILGWWVGPGAGCAGSRVIPTLTANGSPAFGQYKPSETGSGFDPWAVQLLEVVDGRIVEFTFFLATDTLFPLFGLPPRLDA